MASLVYTLGSCRLFSFSELILVNLCMLKKKRRHTSIVAYGKEVFYGSGVHETLPGMSHVRAFCVVERCHQTECFYFTARNAYPSH